MKRVAGALLLLLGFTSLFAMGYKVTIEKVPIAHRLNIALMVAGTVLIDIGYQWLRGRETWAQRRTGTVRTVTGRVLITVGFGLILLSGLGRIPPELGMGGFVIGAIGNIIGSGRLIASPTPGLRQERKEQPRN